MPTSPNLVALAELSVATYDGRAASTTTVDEILRRLDAYRRVFPIGEPAYAQWQGAFAAKRIRNRAAERAYEMARDAGRRLGMPLAENRV